MLDFQNTSHAEWLFKSSFAKPSAALILARIWCFRALECPVVTLGATTATIHTSILALIPTSMTPAISISIGCAGIVASGSSVTFISAPAAVMTTHI
tara:strand:+ start:1414 stop:1704 length:291 start_codon:yes stop_codon:yes gene_type:complete